MVTLGICPKCGVNQKLTKHHIVPVRHGGRKKQVLFICRECHNELEKVIPQKPILEDIEYYKIVIRFLNRKE